MKCNKVKFSNEKFAIEYIEKLKSTSIRDVKPLRAYLCPYCTTWHLTSKLDYETVQQIELKNKILSLEDKLKLKKEEFENYRLRYKNLIKTLNVILNTSNETLSSAIDKKKDRRIMLIGANLMRDLLKECINNLKQ